MKKLFLLITLVMSAVLGMKAVDDVQLVAYPGSSIYNSSYGNLAIDQWNNYRWMSLTNSGTDEGWYVTFDTPIEVTAGEEFCFAIWPENMWPKSGKSYPADNNQGFNGDDNGNMKFSKSGKLNAVRFYWTGNDAAYWAVQVYMDDDTFIPAGQTVSKQSNFGLDVWAMPQGATVMDEPWDIAGGLYAPFIGDTDKHYVSKTKQVEGQYPLAKRFRGSHASDAQKKFLKFCGPLTDAEMERYGDHARHWASADWREGTKFAREAQTELYVIDFCEGNEDDPDHARGLYIRVPRVNDMNLSNYDPASADTKGTDAFYRMGVRFGFIDQSFAESQGNHDDHLRFVKWGHCFRLNEISRPLNAFPVLNADNQSVAYFTDDFGPCEWNGRSAAQGADWTADAVKDLKGIEQKKGDCRIMAERNFWLKRIFLEVAYADEAKKFKRFYIYFDGEYDLNGGSRSFAQDFFMPAAGNFVDQTPNIFHGSNLAAEEAGFHRFHNLDLKQVTELIGVTGPEYQSYTGQHNYLYDLDFTAPYQVESTYAALAKDGSPMKYLNGDNVERSVRYEGRNGEFWGWDDSVNAYRNGLEKHIDSDHNAVIDALETTLIFDPNIPAQVPDKATTRNVYTFPNQAFATVVEDVYPFDPDHIDSDTEIPLNVTKISRHANFTDFTSHVDWAAFQGMTQGSRAVSVHEAEVAPLVQDELFPVANYVVKVAGSVSAERPADSEFKVVALTDGDNSIMLDDANTYWASNDHMTIGDHTLYIDERPAANEYYVHYLVEAYYNICYPVTGILKKARLYNDGAMTQPSELLTTSDGQLAENRTLTTPLAAHADVDEVEFRIAPKKVTGYGYALFNDATPTGIEDVEAAGIDAPAEYYNLQGVRVAQPESGRIYIVRRGAVVTKELAR